MGPAVAMALVLLGRVSKRTPVEGAEAVRKLKIPEVGFEARQKLVIDPSKEQQTFALAALPALLDSFASAYLDKIARVDDVVFLRLAPLKERWQIPAAEQISLSRHDVYASLSCVMSEGERIVAFVPKGSEAVVTKNRQFARFDLPMLIGQKIDHQLAKMETARQTVQ